MNHNSVPSKTEGPREAGRTILVVEDEADTREVFAELLRAEGHRVIAVGSGSEALAYLRGGERPSVILLDMLMPQMDGWQFRKAQQGDPRLADIPVVIVSALRTIANSAIRSGAVAFLLKPVAPEELLGTISKAAQSG